MVMKRYSVEALTTTTTMLVESPSGKYIKAEDIPDIMSEYRRRYHETVAICVLATWCVVSNIAIALILL